MLEAMTSLPPDVITRLTTGSPSRLAAGTAPAGRSPVRLAAESFPHSAAAAVRAAATAASPGRPAVRTVTARPLRRPRRSG
ncbi:MAG TPA: hypothetical protein VMV92_31070 [Streptosporangiaceae bacterium]|nr:hypothetical protein [Streptosporangiaceae bacterium]